MITILALGDSLTAGYGLLPEDSFASRLERALGDEGRDVAVINGGVSGDTAHDGLYRLDPLLERNPDLVIVEFGANDIYQRLPEDEVMDNLEMIIDKCRAIGAEVLLTGVLSLRDPDQEYNTRFHDIYQELSRTKQIPLVPDFIPGIPGNPDLTLPDGIHPNVAGVDVIVDNILPAVRLLLDKNS
ncbi:acyl-CoA thioesterase-1 [Desulfonatronum thiosulfatophilum]|uniref:Acyl-CoA thioesterase-1 n=1 Tax=Desulfonatronum thiosulfatophilum TaxID=617002 RepID=A0A1G6EU73_9BACT|nr:arylesterase [Desulfonatronum thiosulfatophilum]SDB60943.1 acyl-CoA thioesterase-1 [Desulfonatronum thiosulfatophilum]